MQFKLVLIDIFYFFQHKIRVQIRIVDSNYVTLIYVMFRSHSLSTSCSYFFIQHDTIAVFRYSWRVWYV